ncbi:MAG: glucose 1-dehydrogenase [Candidatus Staskawiczbacteria bacterium]|nr:glucose 1-dehydrogenase [Candidatus Staskawiczbacteria bacterium]
MQENKITELFSLKGKVAIVTGAAGGNGRAIAEGFLNAGALIYFVDISKEELEKTAKSLKNQKAKYIIADVTKKDDLEKIISQIIKEEKKIDILVNNAGVTIGEPSELYSEENWEKTYKVNLKAAFLLSQVTAHHMIKQKSGVIINITSLGAEQGFSNNPAYVAFKGGLKQLTKALAQDWAKYNIRVNNLCPGYIKTNMTKKSWDDSVSREERTGRTMLGRWGESYDLVGPAIFLASDASKYITGTDLYVDGGWMSKGI